MLNLAVKPTVSGEGPGREMTEELKYRWYGTWLLRDQYPRPSYARARHTFD